MTDRPASPDASGPADRPASEAAVLAETVDRLRDEVDGLRRAMRSRGVIEQAKGVLMARMSCSADEAFGHLAQLSQSSNMKLVEVAAGLLGVAAPPDAPEPPAPPEMWRPAPGARTDAGAERDAVRPGAPTRLPVHPEAARRGRVPRSNVPLSPQNAARYHLAASVLATASDPDELARLLCRESLAVLGANAVALALLEPDGGLRLTGTYGVSAQRVSEWHRIPPQTSLPLTEAVRTGKPVRVRSRAGFDARYPQVVGEPPMPGEGVWAVPLTGPDGDTRGAMAVSWPEPLPSAEAGDADTEAYLLALGELCVRALTRIAARTEGHADGPAAAGEKWFRALLDALMDPVVILAPVREEASDGTAGDRASDGDGGADAAADGGVGQVVDFRVDYANAATVDLAGRTGEDVLGRRMTELYPGMVASGVFARLLDVQATGTAYEGVAEQFIEVVSGALHSSTMTLRAVRFRDGLLLSWRIHDDDERQAAQFAQAQRLARVGTWQYDVGTGESAWSPEMFAITGRAPDDGVPSISGVAKLVEPRDLPAVREVLRGLMERHEPRTLEFRVVRPDGTTRTVRAAAEAVVAPGGDSVLTLRGVLQDITAWRRAQAALADTRDRLERERGRRAVEHDAVRVLQDALLDAPDADPSGVGFAAHYVPAETVAQVGGDWYDAAALPDGRTLVAIGDVSGHGLPAAAGMTQLRHALRGMAYTGADPARILTWLNQMVCHQKAEYIATAICAHLDTAERTLTWAQAGHLPPLLIRDGVTDVLRQPQGMVLGAIPDATYGSSVVRLEPGDIVLMYTDGLVEHRGDDLGRGLSRLVRTVRAGGATDLESCVAHVMRHLGTPNPQDDTCLIGLQIPRT